MKKILLRSPIALYLRPLCSRYHRGFTLRYFNITRNTYRRTPLFRSISLSRLFIQMFDGVTTELSSALIGWVLMPEPPKTSDGIRGILERVRKATFGIWRNL